MTFSNRPQPSEADQELLSAYIDNELTASERLSFERRLQNEPELHSEIEELRSLKSMLHDLPDVAPPRSFTLDPSMVGKPRGFLPFQYFRFASVLATMLFALILTLNQMTPMASSPQTVSQPESAQLYSAEAMPSEDASARTSKQPEQAMPAAGVSGGAGVLLGAPPAEDATDQVASDEVMTISGDPNLADLPQVDQAPADGSLVPISGQMPADAPMDQPSEQIQTVEVVPEPFNWLAWLSGLLALIAVASGAAAYVSWKRQL
jgi:anti-sigma factor RsiW